MGVSFQVKRTTLTFLAQICPKIDLGLEIQKPKSGFEISTFNTPSVPNLS